MNILNRLYFPLRRWQARRSGATLQAGVTFYGAPQISRHPDSVISIGAKAVICSDSRFTALALDHPVKLSTTRSGAHLSIGADGGMSGACIVCAQRIEIGDQVLLGANVLIVDTDFHPLAPEGRRHSDDLDKIGTAPVVVGDNVFVGTRAILLKGVVIGKDSVVAAGAVVTAGTYPDGAILGGNPARIIGSVYQA